jgi:hypothetical protein
MQPTLEKFASERLGEHNNGSLKINSKQKLEKLFFLLPINKILLRVQK